METQTWNLPKDWQYELRSILTPMLLHISGLMFIGFILPRLRMKSVILRTIVSISIFTLIIFVGWWKTSTDQNLYRLLRIGRKFTVKDIQVGLDRLENSMDEETVIDLEGKLTGETSNYYFKGHDYFGDQYPLADFNAKLSLSKESKKQRLWADGFIWFYSTFLCVPATSPKKQRLILALSIAALSFIKYLLYDVDDSFAEPAIAMQKTIFSQPIFRDWTIFNVGELLNFILTAICLGLASWMTLQEKTRLDFSREVGRLRKTENRDQLDHQMKRVAEEYVETAKSYESRLRSGKIIARAFAAMTILLLGAYVVEPLLTSA